MTTVLERLNEALLHAMETDERVYLLGEDILDPYGGAFKVARGLSSRFPSRILTTPISEAAMVGIANGMALRGLRPVVEIMFGDFVTLVADQLINHAAKFQWMYNDQVRVPLVVRTPMGGRRGYGPTHSQSLEKIFLGVPGLRVVAPNTLSDPADMLQAAILEDDQPVLFVEHKLLYTCALLEAGQGELRDFHMETHGGQYPAHTLRFAGGPPASLTIATYGYHFELARAAALKLAYDYEIFAEILVYSQLSPYQPALLLDSVGRTGRLLTIEEGTLTHGWGAEMGALVSAAGYRLKTARAAGLDLPIANAKSLEDEILPSLEKIVGMAIALVK